MAQQQRTARLRSFRAGFTAFTMAASLLVSSMAPVLAGPGDTNSINDGQKINGGNYYNTAGNSTTFINSKGTGLHLGKGDLVRGQEVNTNGVLTGNGGNILINAPGQVVRLDGNINVNGMVNGGNVKIIAGPMYQSGQIFANGLNGGTVNINASSVTLTKDALIQAQGQGGNGGIVKINSPGAVDIGKGAVIDTTGKVVGNYDTNVISIKGGLVNMDGVLMANGMTSQHSTGQQAQSGGFINIQATGNTKAIDQAAIDKSGLFTSAEKSQLVSRDAAMRNGNTDPAVSNYVGERLNGSIRVDSTGIIAANGANGNKGSADCGCGSTTPEGGGHGGKIVLESCDNIIQNGTITANGGNAGGFVKTQTQLSKDANGNVIKNAQGKELVKGANGKDGGDGGTITFSYPGAMKSGLGSKIEAKGGFGGSGQNADSTHQNNNAKAVGGNGGNGGDGGLVTFNGRQAIQEGGANGQPSPISTVAVDAGKGGKGGIGSTCNPCQGPPENGKPGKPGKPGDIVEGPPPKDCPTCGTPPVTPPPTTPPSNPPGRTIYPKEYPRLGEALPGTVGPVVNYNRSVYMARTPLPIVKKRTPVLFPARSVPPPVVRKVVPPQKKVPVRGYW